MDEPAKTEARNYLSAAGFFLLAANFLLMIFPRIGSSIGIEINDFIHITIGIGLLVIATLLIVLRKRDMIAILFFMMGFLQLFFGFTSPVGTWNFILLSFLVLAVLVTLTSKEKIKWILFLIPAIWFVWRLLKECCGYNAIVTVVFFAVLSVLCLYYAFCCASERFTLPGRKLLTSDESTEFKASGSVLGYMLFSLITGGFALYYIFGEARLPFASLMTIQLITGSLLIYLAVLLLIIGRMRFTPIMFLLIGLTAILNIFSSGRMYIGIGILFLVIGLFSILRKESRILPGIMLILVSLVIFIHDAGGIYEISILAAVLEGIVALIAIYLSFAVYSQRKLPKF